MVGDRCWVYILLCLYTVYQFHKSHVGACATTTYFRLTCLENIVCVVFN